MFGAKRKKLKPEEDRRRCNYVTIQGRCNQGKVTLSKDGVRFPSPYCRYHCCKKVDGAACQDMRINAKGFCQRHIQCQGQVNGTRCANAVRGYDPKEFKFCAQYHNCLALDCKNERFYSGESDLKFCADHRCTSPGCDRPKHTGPFCASHTCEAPNCLAFAVGGGGPGEPTRYCDRHRVCQHDQCERFTHARENGGLSNFCGAHYCAWDGCEQAREDAGEGEHCKAHSCIEVACVKGRTSAEGFFCKNHECDTKECRFRRWRGEYCPEHQCGKPGCAEEGTTDHYCSKHGTCSMVGCDRFRFADGSNPSTPPTLTHDIHWQQSSGANRLEPVKVDAEQSIPNLDSLLRAPSLMSRRYYIETSPSGRPQFVTLKRSRSHHHHHHHRPIEHDDCFVSREDWKALVERERCLRDANDVLTRDNYTLKCTLQATDGELRRYQAWVPQLQDRIQCLAADNAALKRSLDSAGGHSEKHYREIERLKQRLLKADREIGGLNDRLKDMLRRAGHGVQDRIDDLTGIIHDWKRKFEVVDEHNIRLRRDLDNRNSVISEQFERIDAYERIMRRHGLVPR
ncbi:hypothetical protein BN1708_016307 [Verticillium longisporum]|uniref:Uncharacterized protein n=1 Tax=Verticillium longisporum TaxID=100787 RepID=A0A0G4MID5_VERLO|nr:hypothetical protein BN1708_016307 [Verticillium longisporum]